MDKSRDEPAIFFIEKILFSLKLFSGHFYGQFFIKTVRGPWHVGPLKTHISLNIRADHSIGTLWVAKGTMFLVGKPRIRSVCRNGKTDFNLHCKHMQTK